MQGENSQKNFSNTIPPNIMGTMPIRKLIFKVSTPMIISMWVQALYNIVDSVFVAQLNENALAAVSFAFPVQNLMIAITVGTGVGVNAILSKTLGEGDNKKASAIAMNGIFLAFLSTILFMFLGIFFSKKFMMSQTSVAEIVNYGSDYILICTLFSVGVCFQIAFEKTLQSTGMSFYSMITQGVGAIVNIILDPILIFGYFGFPRLEVKGAAIATVIGQVIGALVGLYFNLSKNKELKLKFKGFKPEKQIIKSIYSVGAPSIILQSITSIVTFGFNNILVAFSTTATAIFGVYFKIHSFVLMPILGLNNAMVPILSYNYGLKNKKRITDTIKCCLKISVSITLVAFILFQLFPSQIMSIFKATDDMNTIGVVAVRTCSVAFLFAGVTIIFVSVFQALGFGLWALISSATRQLGILLPVAYLLSLTGKLSLVWWSFSISEFGCLVLCLLFYKDIYNKVIKPLP